MCLLICLSEIRSCCMNGREKDNNKFRTNEHKKNMNFYF